MQGIDLHPPCDVADGDACPSWSADEKHQRFVWSSGQKKSRFCLNDHARGASGADRSRHTPSDTFAPAHSLVRTRPSDPKRLSCRGTVQTCFWFAHP